MPHRGGLGRPVHPVPAVGRPRRQAPAGRGFWRYRRVEDWQHASWRFLYKTLIEKRHWEVLEQDRVMLETMPTDADQRENLYQHDLGVVRLRRLYRAAAEAQSSAGA